MILLDGFSGIGGFAKGLQDAGLTFSEHYFSEVDKHAIANYQYNFKNAKYAGSIEQIKTDTIPRPDLFTFGWPCQDNSIAGTRRGQKAGTRSGLLFEAIRIINEYKPKYFIAENVRGLTSVNGGVDYIETIKLLTYLHDCLPQYTVEMQLFNTSWFLPQNRQRLYFVGHFGRSGVKRIFPFQKTEAIHFTTKKDKKEVHKVASTLMARQYANRCGNFVKEKGNQIRTLTEVECERLQGFPDDWTKYGNYKGTIKPISKNQRYKQLGNAVSTVVVKAIAQKIFKKIKNNKNNLS